MGRPTVVKIKQYICDGCGITFSRKDAKPTHVGKKKNFHDLACAGEYNSKKYGALYKN